MINPYAVMYDATMDVYRYQDATDTEGFNSSEEKCVASGIKCRYSISGQSLASDESYGGYLSKYNIYVMVSEDSKKTEKADWLLEDTIPAGE